MSPEESPIAFSISIQACLRNLHVAIPLSGLTYNGAYWIKEQQVMLVTLPGEVHGSCLRLLRAISAR